MANIPQNSSSLTAMIGSTTTFYEDSLHATQPELEGEYNNAYLQHFPDHNQLYNEYTSFFPPYSSQPFARPPQYLPTPSVSPTSTSGRQIAPVPHQSPYSTLNGAFDQHPQIPQPEPANPSIDNTGEILRPGGADFVPPQRFKSRAKAPPKAAASRKRPKKSADDTGMRSPMGDESDGEEKTGDGPRPIQRLYVPSSILRSTTDLRFG